MNGTMPAAVGRNRLAQRKLRFAAKTKIVVSVPGCLAKKATSFIRQGIGVIGVLRAYYVRSTMSACIRDPAIMDLLLCLRSNTGTNMLCSAEWSDNRVCKQYHGLRSIPPPRRIDSMGGFSARASDFGTEHTI